jgi:phage tail-like protein
MSKFLMGLVEDQKAAYKALGEGRTQEILAEKLANTPESEREAEFSKLKTEAETQAREEKLIEDFSDDQKEDFENLNEAEQKALLDDLEVADLENRADVFSAEKLTERKNTRLDDVTDEQKKEFEELSAEQKETVLEELKDVVPEEREATFSDVRFKIRKNDILSRISSENQTEFEDLNKKEQELLLDKLEPISPDDRESEFENQKDIVTAASTVKVATVDTTEGKPESEKLAEDIENLEGLTPEQKEKIKELSPEEQKALIAKLKATPVDEREREFAELKAEVKRESGKNMSKGALNSASKTTREGIDKVKDAVLEFPPVQALMTGLGILEGIAEFFSDKPHPNFCFNVHFIPNSLSLALLAQPLGWNFQEVSGIEYSMDTEKIQEGGENRFEHRVPARTSHGNLVLKRAMKTRGITTALTEWCVDSVERDLSKRIRTADVLVSLLGTNPYASFLTDSSVPISVWHFRNAYPVRWKMGDFNAQSGEILIEEIELCYSYFTRKL